MKKQSDIRVSQGAIQHIKEMRLPKKSGGFRIVCCPDKATKERLRYCLPFLEDLQYDVGEFYLPSTETSGCCVAHGFFPGRTPVTNAAMHIGYQWTLSLDLCDCFGNATKEKVFSALKPYFDTTNGGCISATFELTQKKAFEEMADLFFISDVAMQGLPTSPALANIALAPLDALLFKTLSEVAETYKLRFAITRYADDYAVSCNDRNLLLHFKGIISNIIQRNGWEINAKKTRMQSALFGNRIITGVSVGYTSASATRAVRRRMRAANHQNNEKEAKGYNGWCDMCKTAYTPAEYKRKDI